MAQSTTSGDPYGSYGSMVEALRRDYNSTTYIDISWCSSHKAPANARYGDYKTCYGIGDHPTNLRGPFAAGKEDCEDACDQDSQCTHYVMQGGAACTLSNFGPMKTRTLYIKDPSGRK